jgi:hypothetical protein
MDSADKRMRLAMAFGMTIQQFTSRTPMTVLDICEALAFTAGHAIMQPSARKSMTMSPNQCREFVIAMLDKGMQEGAVDRTKPELFIPPPKEIN